MKVKCTICHQTIKTDAPRTTVEYLSDVTLYYCFNCVKPLKTGVEKDSLDDLLGLSIV